MTGIPAATAFWMLGPSAFASGIETTRPCGFLATAASISCAILVMSNVSGAAYSTLTPMSLPAWSTPFLKIDQNGSDACPWVTTSIRMLEKSKFMGARCIGRSRGDLKGWIERYRRGSGGTR